MILLFEPAENALGVVGMFSTTPVRRWPVSSGGFLCGLFQGLDQDSVARRYGDPITIAVPFFQDPGQG